jgi:hypothetical protein
MKHIASKRIQHWKPMSPEVYDNIPSVNKLSYADEDRSIVFLKIFTGKHIDWMYYGLEREIFCILNGVDFLIVSSVEELDSLIDKFQGIK